MTDHPQLLTRRRAITLLAVTAAGGALLPQRVFAQAAGANAAAFLPGADVCVLTPEVTEGPYYFDPALVREDIAEGRPGIPITVRMQVVDAACRPMPNARVDIWHCDATGLYSNYAGQGDDRGHPVTTVGESFLRGTLFSDDHGVVNFKSIYPGWYRGRTTHVHFKIFLDETNVLTGQIFFPDALSEFIYRNVSPYSDRTAERDTLNDGDMIAQQASRASFANIKEEEEEYLVSLIVGVNPDAVSAGFAGGPGGQPPNSGPMPPGGPGGPPDNPAQSGSRTGSLVPGPVEVN